MPYLASESTPRRELVDAARAIIDRQESETWQWYDADLLRFLLDGIDALERLRPAAGYVGLRRAPRVRPSIPVRPERADYPSDADFDEAEADWLAAVDALLAEPVLVDGRWHQALVEYVCYEAFRRDESDAASQRLAQQHYQSFAEISQR